MIKIGKDISSFSTRSCQPISRDELRRIINQRISKEGKTCNLNDIDTSLIIDMSYLFYGLEFNGNISDWDVSNVTDMSYMFYDSPFNGDISRWDLEKAKNLQSMFERSKFNSDISRWKMPNVRNMSYMFCASDFNQDISRWMIDKTRCNIFLIFSRSSIKEEFKPNSLR